MPNDDLPPGYRKGDEIEVDESWGPRPASERISELASELEAEKVADLDPSRQLTEAEARWAYVVQALRQVGERAGEIERREPWVSSRAA